MYKATATYLLQEDHPGFRFTDRGEIETKGKDKMAMYFVEHA